MKYMILIFLMLISNAIQGTDNSVVPFDIITKIQPMEPTTASLGRYGEYPMDISNGIPDISILLYEIKSGDLTVPIVLRYQSGGIKVHQEATWVGLGWDLFYGGQITRVVNGLPDDKQENIPSATDVLAYLEQHDSNLLDSYTTSLAKNDLYMPDEYYYNIGLESGKFVGWNGESLIPYKPIKINRKGNSFKLTNAKGEVYSFIHGETTDSNIQHYGDYTSAWHVNNIVSPDNHHVNYIYQQDGYYYPTRVPSGGYYQGYSKQYYDNEHIGKMIERYYLDSEMDFNIIDIINPLELTPVLLTEYFKRPKINSKKPQYITFNGGRLQFVLSPREDIHNLSGYTPIQKLECIVVQRLKPDNTYETVKFIMFDYFYKDDRLMLNRVYETTLDTERIIAKFEYDPTPLPKKNSYNYDYCGYYNESHNFTPIARYDIEADFTIGGANKNVVEQANKAAVLTAIEHPTKGKTVFTWENHRYGANEPLYAGQYTTYKSISLSPSTTQSCSDLPSPFDEGLSSSTNFINLVNQHVHVSGKLKRNDIISHQHGKYDKGKIIFKDITDGTVLLQNNLIATPTVINEVLHLKANHTYSVVVTKNCFNVSASIGFTYNEYNPEPDKYNYPYGGLRIKEITNYEPDGKLLERTLYTYVDPEDPHKSSGYITNLAPVLTQRTFKQIKKISAPVGSLFEMCANIITQTHLFYDNPIIGIYPNNLSYQYVQTQKITADNTNNGITVYEYSKAFDTFINTDIPIISKSHIRGQLLKESIYSNTNNLLKETTNFYSYHPMVTAKSKGFKLASTFNGLESIICNTSGDYRLNHIYVPYEYTYYSEWYKTDSTIVRDYSVLGYIENKTTYTHDDLLNGLPTQVVSFNNGKQITKIYEYEYQRPVFEEELINNQPLKKWITKYHKKSLSINSSMALSIDSILVQYGTMPSQTELRVSKRDAKNNNILQYDTKDNVPVTYLWGYNSQYPIAEIKGATYAEVTAKIPEFTLSEIAARTEPTISDLNTINSLRIQLPNAQVTTYTYEPLVGMTSMTAPHGITTYYEYDSFGRLKVVKDGAKTTPAGSETKRNVESYDYHYKNQ